MSRQIPFIGLRSDGLCHHVEKRHGRKVCHLARLTPMRAIAPACLNIVVTWMQVVASSQSGINGRDCVDGAHDCASPTRDRRASGAVRGDAARRKNTSHNFKMFKRGRTGYTLQVQPYSYSNQYRVFVNCTPVIRSERSAAFHFVVDERAVAT